MAKTDEQRGPVAAWLRRERLGRGWSQKDVADRIGITEMSYRAYEAGPRVSNPVRKALEQLYGTRPPDPSTPAPDATDMAALVAALSAQTEAMHALVAVLARSPMVAPVDEKDAIEVQAMYRRLVELTQSRLPLGEPRQSEDQGAQDASAGTSK